MRLRVDDVRFRIVARARPVCPAAGVAQIQRPQISLGIADHGRKKHRSRFVARHRIACACARSSGVKSIRSSGILRKLRAYAGGLVGKGCVGEVFSPGTSDCGTGRSSIGHTGCPVTRSKTYRYDSLLGKATALIAFPSDVDIGQDGRGRKIVVPDRVMHHLEMPLPLAGLQIDAHQALAEQDCRPAARRHRNPRSAIPPAGTPAPGLRPPSSGSTRRCCRWWPRNRFPRSRCRTRRGEEWC